MGNIKGKALKAVAEAKAVGEAKETEAPKSEGSEVEDVGGIEGVMHVRTIVANGRRYRAGLEFANQWSAFNLNDLSEEQIAQIKADTFLIVKL